MTVRPVAAKHEAGKSFELWIIDDSLGKPKSLGVIDEATPMKKPTLAALQSRCDRALNVRCDAGT